MKLSDNKLLALCSVGCLVVLFASMAVNATTLYRWTDGSGVAHFGSSPPEGVEAEIVSNYSSQALSEIDTSKDGKTQSVSEEFMKRCNTEVARLKKLESGAALKIMGDDGKARNMTLDEIAQEIAISKQEMRRFCPEDMTAL